MVNWHKNVINCFDVGQIFTEKHGLFKRFHAMALNIDR